MKDHYINYVLEGFIADGNFDSLFGNKWIDEARFAELSSEVCDSAFSEYGIIAKGRYAPEVAAILGGMIDHVIAREGDDYSDHWFKLRPSNKAKYVDQLRAKNPATVRLNRLGEEALTRALKKIATEDGLRTYDEEWGYNEETEAPRTNASPDQKFFNSEERKVAFITAATQQLVEVDEVDLSNSEKSQARGYLQAAKALAEIPDPPTDIIWTILTRASSIAGIASFFVALIALLANVG